MNFCKDCKHIRRSITGLEFARCAALADPVSGGGGDYCETARKYGPCGKEGKLFEQKITMATSIAAMIFRLKNKIEVLKSNQTTKE